MPPATTTGVQHTGGGQFKRSWKWSGMKLIGQLPTGSTGSRQSRSKPSRHQPPMHVEWVISPPWGDDVESSLEVKDRRRPAIRPGQQVNFVLLEPHLIPPFDTITSVAVVPFTPDGRIVAALLDRGVDLPGGHVQETERTIEETARREVMEEVGITLKDLFAVNIIQSDYYG